MAENENIEKLFDEAVQATDEAGSEEEKETETSSENEEETVNTETPAEDTDTPSDEENIEEEEEDLEDPALILQRYKSLKGMYKSQKQKLEKLQKEESTTKEEQAKEEPSKEEASKEKPADNETIDTSWVSEALNDNEYIKDFGEDFPEIKEVLEASLKSVMERYTQAMSQAFQTLLQQIDQKYQPVAQSVGEISKRERDAEVKSYHSDYDKIVNSQELNDWIDSQPKRLKETYNSILQDGAPEEIVEVLNDFKLKTGIKTPQGKKTPKVTPQTKTKAPSSKQPVDMDDFEQAFQEAIREGD